VESPYKIDDPSSGTRREIDIALIAPDGTVFIALECQDRKKKSDLAWIEQLITKAQAVGAPKAVAVSRSGFTKGARRRALAAGIELREIQALSDEDFRSWMPRIEMTPFSLSHPVTEVVVAPADPADNPAIQGRPVSSISFALGEQPVTLEDLFEVAVLKRARRQEPELRRDQIDYSYKLAYILDGCKAPDATKVVRLDFPEGDLVARVPGGDVKIRSIEMVFSIGVALFEAAEKTSGKYVGEDGAIRGFMNTRLTPPGSNPDFGGMTISIAAPPPPEKRAT
jgi:Restriction endonuclease